MNRYLLESGIATDRQTDLMWTINASLFDFPMSWSEALHNIRELNKSNFYGYGDWRVPNRKELLTLISYDTINPSLTTGHPFKNVFNGYYWTSTTCARLPNQAWYIHLGGARVFKGMKYGSYMVWPVRTGEKHSKCKLFATGQEMCFDENGNVIDCHGTGQDGEIQADLKLPKHRYTEKSPIVNENDTGLTWLEDANIFRDMMDWNSAFDSISEMNRESKYGYNDWRIPNIIELESLTDMGQHSPALQGNHLFYNVKDFYWSSTTSIYDINYAWVLYLIDGAVGVGYKQLSEFYLWPVRGKERRNSLTRLHQCKKNIVTNRI